MEGDNTKLSIVFDKNYQAKILNYIFKNHLFGQRCCLHLCPSYFENAYFGWVFKKIKDHFEKYNVIPTRGLITNHIKSIRPEEQPNYKKILKSIFEAKIVDEHYIKDTLTEFIQASEFKKLHKKAGELYNQNNHQEAFSYVQEKIEEIKKIRFTEDSYVKPEDILPILQSNKDIHKNRCLIGIDPIDEFLGGGIPKGTTTTIIGGYNVGKTITSINIACENIEKGNKVLFIYHEGTENEIVTKFVSRLTGISVNKLFAYDVNEEDLKIIKSAENLIGERLRIKEMRRVGVSVYDVVNYARETYSEWPFDMLIDDYAMILDAKSTARKIDKRHQVAENFRVLDQLSSSKDGLDIAVVNLAQFNREGKKKGTDGYVLRSDDIAECIDINKISATILTLSEVDGSIVVCLDKSRISKKGFLVKLNSDLSRMRIFHKTLGWDKLGFYDPEIHNHPSRRRVGRDQ